MVAFCVPQTVVGNPVQLTVGKTTRLLLNMTRDPASSNHTIEGWLKYGSAPVINRTISIRVNETMYSYSVQTDSQGHFIKVLGLQPVNNTETPYVISASFEGDAVVTATASAKTLEGKDYPACTTIQYNDYKPSSNSTLVLVEPQSTPGDTPTPPDQLPDELTVWHEFTWQYPWYRMHFVLNVPLRPYGTVYVDFGWSPLPFGTSFRANMTVFGLILNDLGIEITEDIILSFALAYIIQRVAAGLAGRTLAGIALAIAGYTAYSIIQAGILYVTSRNNPKAWLIAFLSSAIGSLLDQVINGLNDVWEFLTAISRRLVGGITHTLNSMWARGLDFFDITGVAFSFIDFAFMILYLNQYKSLVG